MNQQEAIVKIRKLFALADSPNANEAKAALMQAHRLMAKWNIDALQADQEEIEHITEESKGGNTKYYISLAQVIATNFRCKFYIAICIKFVIGNSNQLFHRLGRLHKETIRHLPTKI